LNEQIIAQKFKRKKKRSPRACWFGSITTRLWDAGGDLAVGQKVPTPR